jgi:hypothetical protein
LSFVEFIQLHFEKNYPWVNVSSIALNKRIKNLDALEEEYRLVLEVLRQVSEGSPETVGKSTKPPQRESVGRRENLDVIF